MRPCPPPAMRARGWRHPTKARPLAATARLHSSIWLDPASSYVVEDAALVAALKEGRLGAAALDVFADEPNVPQDFFGLEDKLILQPHQASATHDTRRAMSQLCMDNVRAFLDGSKALTPIPESK